MKATDVQRATMRQGIINKLSSTWSGTAQDLTSTVAQMEAKVFSKSSTYETYVAACHKRVSKAAAAAPTQVQQPAPALPAAAAAPALTQAPPPHSVCGGNHGVRGDGGGI